MCKELCQDLTIEHPKRGADFGRLARRVAASSVLAAGAVGLVSIAPASADGGYEGDIIGDDDGYNNIATANSTFGGRADDRGREAVDRATSSSNAFTASDEDNDAHVRARDTAVSVAPVERTVIGSPPDGEEAPVVEEKGWRSWFKFVDVDEEEVKAEASNTEAAEPSPPDEYTLPTGTVTFSPEEMEALKRADGLVSDDPPAELPDLSGVDLSDEDRAELKSVVLGDSESGSIELPDLSGVDLSDEDRAELKSVVLGDSESGSIELPDLSGVDFSDEDRAELKNSFEVDLEGQPESVVVEFEDLLNPRSPFDSIEDELQPSLVDPSTVASNDPGLAVSFYEQFPNRPVDISEIGDDTKDIGEETSFPDTVIDRNGNDVLDSNGNGVQLNDYPQASVSTGDGGSSAPAPVSQAAPSDAECVDTDGDGWGWDGSESCPLNAAAPSPEIEESGNHNPLGHPRCEHGAATDHDGDGWGWENHKTCLV